MVIGAIDWTLCAIVDLGVVAPERAPELARAAAAGGAGVLQLRGKTVPAGVLLDTAELLQGAIGVPLIVNDRVDVAALAAADGVHLGDDDLPLEAASRLLPGRWLGRTVRDPRAARAAVAAGAGYLGVGSVYQSATKRGVPHIGLEGLAAVAAAVDRPVVAIGGIDADGAAACVEAGARGVAVIGALFAGDPPAGVVEKRARRLRRRLDAAGGPGRSR
ncbi:MAG: thiamine phosphate synthase [Candidatus Eiseniibacteriota bacterium]|jgi:thiamine-phosphate diphosphorylase